MSHENCCKRLVILVTAAELALGTLAGLAQTASNITNPVSATPSFKPTPEQVGDSLMVHQRYQAAIETYKTATPTSVLWNKMGIAYQLMYNINDAERCYQTAIRLDPKNATAINNLGSVYMARRDYGRAQKSYRKALKMDGQSALYLKNLGTALLADRRYKKGAEAYQNALRLDPKIFDHNTSSVRVENPASLQDRGAMNFYMAKSCVKAGMLKRAVEYLRMALNEGFTTPKKIMADAELASLRDEPDFQRLLESQGVYLTPITAHAPVQQ